MTSQFNKTKKIPIKHKDVLKATSIKSNEPIVISPVKQFATPVSKRSPAPSALNQNIGSVPSSNDEHPSDASSFESPVESAAENTLDIIQEDSLKPDINSLDVMKRNINEEVQAYKNEQLNLIQDELEKLKKDTVETAYNEAVADGKKVYDAKIQELSSKSNELLTAIDQLGASKKEDLFQKRDLVIKLAVEMAEKIVKKQIQLDPSTFESLFAEAFERITDKDHVCIEVNPEDLAAVNSYKDKFESKFKSIEKLDIKETTDITRGGCTIETNLGYIDATVNSKLELLYQGFQAFHVQYDDDQKQSAKKVSGPSSETQPIDASTPVETAEPSVEEDSLGDDDLGIVEDASDSLDSIDETNASTSVEPESSASDDDVSSDDDDNFSFDEDFDFDDLDDDFDFDDDLE